MPTKAYYENKLIAEIRERGCCTIWMLTQNKYIAAAADRLCKSGRLNVSGGQFPAYDKIIIDGKRVRRKPNSWRGRIRNSVVFMDSF